MLGSPDGLDAGIHSEYLFDVLGSQNILCPPKANYAAFIEEDRYITEPKCQI